MIARNSYPDNCRCFKNLCNEYFIFFGEFHGIETLNQSLFWTRRMKNFEEISLKLHAVRFTMTSAMIKMNPY